MLEKKKIVQTPRARSPKIIKKKVFSASVNKNKKWGGCGQKKIKKTNVNWVWQKQKIKPTKWEYKKNGKFL